MISEEQVTEAELVWREQRILTGVLTLHYNKAMFILEPSPAAQALARKKMGVCEFPCGRLEIRHEGTAFPYRMCDKAPSPAASGPKLDRRRPGNKRLRCGPRPANEELDSARPRRVRPLTPTF